jgi:UDP-N-acetylmuramoyl-tripeptide--D-alanyl-D-alanine ligase
VLNADHSYLPVLLEEARARGIGRIITYGYAPGADWRIEAVEFAETATVAHIRRGGETIVLTLGLKGRHMVANAVAALIVGELFGVEQAAALKSLDAFGAPEGRGQALRLGAPERPLLLIDESYNANGASMIAALDVFGTQRAPGGKKVLVLGDMLELGAQAPALHRALKQSVLEAGADRLFLVGPHMGELGETLGPNAVAGHAHTTDDIAQIVLDELDYGDAIMIKGSNGVRLSGLVQAIRNRFE